MSSETLHEKVSRAFTNYTFRAFVSRETIGRRQCSTFQLSVTLHEIEYRSRRNANFKRHSDRFGASGGADQTGARLEYGGHVGHNQLEALRRRHSSGSSGQRLPAARSGRTALDAGLTRPRETFDFSCVIGHAPPRLRVENGSGFAGIAALKPFQRKNREARPASTARTIA